MITDWKNTLVVGYRSYSHWYFHDNEFDKDEPLPFELKDVHDWYVKWDTLNVQHTPDGEWVEYDPHWSACDSHDFKRPDEIEVDGEVMKR